MFDRGRSSDRQGRGSAIVVLVGLLAVGVVAGPLGACGWPADRPSPEITAPAEQATLAPAVASPTRVSAPSRLAATPQDPQPSPEPLVNLAIADAARRTGAVPSDVRIVQVEARAWPDRSLGCPRPGMGYAQSITPGLLIVVEADGRRLEYHTDHAEVMLCGS